MVRSDGIADNINSICVYTNWTIVYSWMHRHTRSGRTKIPEPIKPLMSCSDVFIWRILYKYFNDRTHASLSTHCTLSEKVKKSILCVRNDKWRMSSVHNRHSCVRINELHSRESFFLIHSTSQWIQSQQYIQITPPTIELELKLISLLNTKTSITDLLIWDFDYVVAGECASF